MIGTAKMQRELQLLEKFRVRLGTVLENQSLSNRSLALARYFQAYAVYLVHLREGGFSNLLCLRTFGTRDAKAACIDALDEYLSDGPRSDLFNVDLSNVEREMTALGADDKENHLMGQMSLMLLMADVKDFELSEETQLPAGPARVPHLSASSE